MAKSILILSTIVDNTIKELLPDDTVRLFTSVSSLSDYVAVNAVRVDTMYVTRDVLGAATNTVLGQLANVLSSPFYSVKEVIYITEPPAKEVASLNYLIQQKGWDNWDVVNAPLNREYLMSYISGSLQTDEVKPTRRIVRRVPINEYIKERTAAGKPLDKYETEEESLAVVEGETLTDKVTLSGTSNCKVRTISGVRGQARPLFTVLLAQYLSHNSKVLMVEYDTDYLELTNMCQHLDNVAIYDAELLYQNAELFLLKIRREPKPIILVTDRRRSNYDTTFTETLLYSNLVDHFDYLLSVRDFTGVPPLTNFIVVFDNNVPTLLRMAEEVVFNKAEQVQFVAMNTSTLDMLEVPNTLQLKRILEDVFQEEVNNISILEANSVKLGGESHDLRMYA